MRSSKWTRRAVVQGLILAVGAGTVYADAPAAKWYDTIGLSGYLQSSYGANLSSPHDGPGGANTGARLNNVGRQFDTDPNGFAFNAFLLQIAKPVGDSDHYGFTVRLRTGQDAQSIAPNGSSIWVQEAYATYAVPSTKLSITGGKFVTSEGYEVVDTVSNPNYSEGLLFFAAEPIGHTGVKANYVFSDKVNATLGVVNGWDALPGNQGAPDINDGKTIMWQVATTPIKQIAWSFQGLYGKELPDPSHSERLSLDTVLTYAPIDKLSLAVQGNWGEQTNDPGMVNNDGTGTNTLPGTTHWVGAGFWASFAETSKCTTSVRFEVMNDQNFANRFGAGTFNGTTHTTNQTVKEFTISQKYMLTTAMGIRPEFRHDWSNEAYFVGHDGTPVRNQNTISADWFVTF